MAITVTLVDVCPGTLLAVVAALLGLSTLVQLASITSGRVSAIAFALSALACAGVFALGVVILATGAPVAARTGQVLGFALVDVRYDALSAPFLIALGAVGAMCSLYGIGYRGHRAVGHGARGHGGRDATAAAYPVFLASLLVVFGAADAFGFLLVWELMALSSAALVVGSRPSEDRARTAYLYLALTHLATAALIVAFAILSANAGSTGFDAFGHAAAGLPPVTRDVVFVLMLIGFGTKAGAIPFHVWLPRAHPVAPSHVSALMSGVMIKVGIYGLIRFGLQIMGPGPEWWGLLVLGIGVASAVMGVLYALMEHDLKRLLAFHSIENIGIILIGVGIAMLAMSHGVPALAGLALTAALFHTLNHGLFKAVLFLAAGSVQSAAGTRDLNALGGLARAMPLTALAFGIGAAAISGLPPLNGFASEWLTFQGLIGAGGEIALSPIARSAALLSVGALGLTAALAVACFVKATGMTFLALPRSPGAAGAREVAPTMRVATAALAAACVGVGLAAGPVARVLADVAGGVVGRVSVGGAVAPGAAATVPASLAGDVWGVTAGGAVYAAGAVAVLLVAVAAVTWFVGSRGRSPRPATARPVTARTRRVPTWTCGIAPEPAFEYTATSFAKLIRLYFGPVLRPAREITVELHPGTPFPRTVRYRGEVRHVLDERLYRPLHGAAVAAAELVRRLQNGSLQLYLAYAVAALVVLLLVAR